MQVTKKTIFRLRYSAGLFFVKNLYFFSLKVLSIFGLLVSVPAWWLANPHTNTAIKLSIPY